MEQNTNKPNSPRIKVCGVTRREDLDTLAESGVDAVGFNFVPRSPRCLDVARAALLSARAASLGLSRVGVFMDSAPSEVAEVASQVGLDVIQLHGGEMPEDGWFELGYPIIKALSWSGREQERTLAKAWQKAGQASPAHSANDHSAQGQPVQSKPVHGRPRQGQLLAFLVDAYAPDVGGGSGKVARWDLLGTQRCCGEGNHSNGDNGSSPATSTDAGVPRPEELRGVALLLAGGLSGRNVAEAIAKVHPDGVDTASGVETSPGIKSSRLVREFASAAKAAWMASED